MQRITCFSDIDSVTSEYMRDYLTGIMDQMKKDYGAYEFERIGCFILLDSSEHRKFNKDEMEFVEELLIGKERYIHGVKILGDCYGEDTYLRINKSNMSESA
jgi:hypothetical protein